MPFGAPAHIGGIHMKRLDNTAKMCIGLEWSGVAIPFFQRNFHTVRIMRHDPKGIPPDGGRGAFLYALGGDAP